MIALECKSSRANLRNSKHHLFWRTYENLPEYAITFHADPFKICGLRGKSDSISGQKYPLQINRFYTFLVLAGLTEVYARVVAHRPNPCPNIFCSKTRISRRFGNRRGPRKVCVSACTPDRHDFCGSLKIGIFRQCYPRTHQDFGGSNSLPTRVSSARLTKKFSVFGIR